MSTLRKRGSRLGAGVALCSATLAIAGSGVASAQAPVLAAGGDVACVPGATVTSSACRQKATSDILVGLNPTAVAALGDLQYESGTLSAFNGSFDPSWGRVKPLIRPVAGNKEYGTSGAAGYFDYFGSAAGPRGRGYYSYDLGSWHVIALNSNCSAVSCSAGSTQERWLRADLAANPRQCTLAYWHHPRFSSASPGEASNVAPLWKALHDNAADIVLAGHAHAYERFAPQGPSRESQPTHGIREFVVGTGGKSHHGFSTTRANSELRRSGTFGVLALTLGSGSYAWRFHAEAGSTFTDSGSGQCVGSATTTPPPDSGALSFTPEADAPVQASSPNTNYATSALRADGGSDPDVDSYLRFSVSGLTGSVASAKLRLRATSGTADGPAVYGAGNSWTETGITWANRPSRATAAIADKGSIASGTVAEYDVTSYVNGNGTFSFDLGTGSTDGVDFYSREGSTKPQLVITTR